ncbi:metacaspase-1-like [Diospyros lotus]|uniref:metacaspase-1-like n=1 Tax=Diospyros lotus TaxID=55363 RepID=UPI002253539F|nr:metacaspase-1-like [Diospyros lotus]
MARVICTNCRAKLLVPYGVSIIKCPLCYSTIVFQNNNDYLAPVVSQYNGYGNSYYPTGSGNSHHRQPPFPSYHLSPLSVHGRKRAVLIGISYHGQQNSIKGSVNDVRMMSYFLVNRFRFPNESIFVLTEEERDPYRMPTKRNIQTALHWLIQSCQSGDSLVLFYSGHGTKVTDINRDEIDGFDEALCPVDFQTQGMILDDEINATIVRPLPHGVRLHAIIDTCNSGTSLDLPFLCRMNQTGYYAWQDHRVSYAYKGTSGGVAFCFSACNDDENSLDTTAFSGGISTGAMTYSFIEAVQNEHGLTYGRLLQSLRSKIVEAQKHLYGPYTPTWASQVPQLSCTEEFDIHSKQFII